MKKPLSRIVFLAVCLVGTSSAMAQGTTNYTADIFTFGTNRFLWLNSTSNSPVGTPIWFVADQSGNGLGFNAGSPGPVDIGVVAAFRDSLGDDRLVYQNIVDGGLPGGNFGRIGNLLAIPISPTNGVRFTDQRLGQEENQPTHVWAVLWNDTTPGEVGDSFGVLDLGLVPYPTTGNAQWNISANVFADTFLVTAIPEPSTIALGVLGFVGLVGYRRYRK